MPSDSAKKLSILYILDILKEYSDENHPITQSEIGEKIYSIYGMECERKSISNNIKNLIDLGYDIKQLPKGGCFLVDRDFEPSEINFLVDAIFSSKSIDSKHSKDLAQRLSKYLSKYQRKKYNYIYKADEITRTSNKDLFYNIDIINEAIEKGKKITFNYNRFYIDKEQNEKAKKKKYLVNPYFMINNQGEYYLVCNYNYFNTISNYKIKLISNIQITDKDVKPINELENCKNGIDIAKYANENIYMFNNKSVVAKLKIENDYSANYVLEWFGNNCSFETNNNGTFAKIKANEQALIYWCLQYGENIELVEPLETREKIKNILLSMNDKYFN